MRHRRRPKDGLTREVYRHRKTDNNEAASPTSEVPRTATVFDNQQSSKGLIRKISPVQHLPKPLDCPNQAQVDRLGTHWQRAEALRSHTLSRTFQANFKLKATKKQHKKVC